MTTIQDNINVGMAISKALEIATTVKVEAIKTNKLAKPIAETYEEILQDADKLIPRIIKLIKETRKSQGL